MSGLKKETDAFIESVKKSEEYLEYHKRLEEIKQDEELWKKVVDYRRKRYNLQNMANEEELFDKSETFEKDYVALKDTPGVSEYLDAEVALCRLVQEVCMKISEAIDFE